MGRGVTTPEYRGATARRMMREAEERERSMADALGRARKDSAHLRAQLNEAERLCAVKDDALRMAQERIDAEVTVAAHLSRERDAACGALADLIESNIAAHKAAIATMEQAEAERARISEEE